MLKPWQYAGFVALDADSGGNSGGEPTPPTLTTGTSSGTGNQPDYKALYEQSVAKEEEWKRRFTGLQPLYQKTQDENANLNAKTIEIQEALKKLNVEHEGTIGELSKVKETHDQMATEYEVLKAEKERISTVVTKFPQLLPFLNDGTLPDGTGEEFEKKLSAMAARLEEVAKGGISKTLQGVPPPPPPSTERTREIVQKEMNGALLAGEYDKYNTLYAELLNLQK